MTGKRRPIVNYDEAAAISDYVAGASTLELGRKYGVHHSRIHRLMVRVGVSRSRKEAFRLRTGGLTGNGSIIGLAADLGMEVKDLVPLLIKHGFTLEKRS
jgi:hypothetical protein